MKAIVLTKPTTLELRDIPRPTLTEENHVLVKVRACGICGSDLRYWAGENPWALHTLGRHVDNPPNMVMGHELAGEVVEVNAKEHEHWLGQRVGVQAYRVCGQCKFCQTGRENLCRNMIHIGHAQGWGQMEYYPGGYAEYCVGWADLLFPMPEPITFGETAMGDILCVATHLVGRVHLYQGATVLCIGGGPAGLGIALLAKTRGAKTIFLSEPSPVAQQVIRQYPDFKMIDPNRQNVADVIKTVCGDTRCAAIFDSVGNAETMALALPLLEESGTYVNLAVHDAEVSFNAMALGSERTITTSSNAFYRDVSEAYQLIHSGTIDIKPWITHRFKLEEYEQAFSILLESPKAAYKVVFEPWQSV